MKVPLALSILAFSIPALPSPSIVYGEDNRLDSYEASIYYQKLALATAAKISKKNIFIKDSRAELKGILLRNKTPNNVDKICEKEKFSHQVASASCSGFLVQENILITAGHCMTSKEECENNSWVFNYKVRDKTQSVVSVDMNDVVNCKRIIKKRNNYLTGLDFAVIELDRSVDKAPLKLASALPTEQTPLILIGHRNGLPQKITTNGFARSIKKTSFRTNLDAFRGNSGSAVLDAQTGEVYGILINGNRDYKLNSDLGCMEVNSVRANRFGERVNTYLQFQDYL